MDELTQAIVERLEDGRLPCPAAFVIARRLGVEPLVVGQAADLGGIRISRCQLGLFGYGPKAEGKHKIVHAADAVPEPLAAGLRAAAGDDGISCAAVWQVAREMHCKRIEASNALEAMGVRVSRCQLGCFPRPWEG